MKICVVAHRVRGTLRMLLKGGDSVGNGGGCWDMGKKKRTTRITRTGLSKNNVNECWF